MIRGKYVVLKAMEEKDATILQKWYLDKDFRRSYDAYSSVSMESILKDIRESGNLEDPTTETVYYLVASKKEENPIGVGCLRNIDRQNGNAELVLGIGEKDKRLAGYGVDLMISLLDIVFYQLNFEKAYLKISDKNELGLKSALSFGFVSEGRLRNHRIVDGQYEDLHILGLIKEEYEKLPLIPRWKARK